MSLPPTLVSAWRSKQHVGPVKPTAVVQIQRGVMDRHFSEFVMSDGSKPKFGWISLGKHRRDPWNAYWRATGSWITLPNVLSIDLNDSFDGDGVGEPTTATIVTENVGYETLTGPSGQYTKIHRGFFAPFYGYRALNRPSDEDATDNEWLDRYYGGYRIRVYQGYGTAQVQTFMGLIDDTDTQSKPDQITMTCRSFGKLLTDQRLFGNNKAADIGSPVTFCDRLKADNTKKVGSSAKASSFTPGYPASNVTKPGDSSAWISQKHHTTPGNTEWVQIRLPAGRYDTFYLNPGYDNMEVYLSVYVHTKGIKETDARLDFESVTEGWVHRGLGDVPGTDFPYVKKWNSMDSGGKVLELPFEMVVGNDTIIRISFRNLHRNGNADYRAKCYRLCSFKRKRNNEARSKHWVLVDDAADVVRWVLLWAGFKDWDIDNFGVRLAKPITFHQGDYLIDVIRYIVQQGNYVFYVLPSQDYPDSIGKAYFKKAGALNAADSYTQEVRDTDLLTSMQTKFSKETLSFIIRARGRATTKADKKKKIKGKTLGEDKVARLQAVYLPPWSGARPNLSGPFPAGRVSGVVKHAVHYDPLLDTEDEAYMACILIAIQEALAAYTGSFSTPGLPFRLNDQVSIVDTPSGTNSRMWISSVSSSFQQGAETSYTSSVSGPLVDWPDLNFIAIDYLAALIRIQAERAV